MPKQTAKIQKRVSIAVLGEKDHGKSTLLGRFLFETGNIPEDRIAEIKKAVKKSGKRFEWAHLLDSFRYEREKEMTLDASRAVAEVGRNTYELIDVPGHRELLKNMLSGTSRADTAVLVVAADEGIRPQTIRHLEIAKFIGISCMVAIINKCDLIGYSHEKYADAEKALAGLLRSHGFKNAFIIPASAFYGDNVAHRGKHLNWFRGPTMLSAFKKIAAVEQVINTPGARKDIARRRVVYASCILLEKPHTKKIVLETGTQKTAATLKTRQRKFPLGGVAPFTIKLTTRTAIADKFVLKENGVIIGLGRISAANGKPA